MSHDAEFVQRRLPVEEDDVAINHVSLNHITVLQLLSHLLPITVLQKPETRSQDIHMINKWRTEKLKLSFFADMETF